MGWSAWDPMEKGTPTPTRPKVRRFQDFQKGKKNTLQPILPPHDVVLLNFETDSSFEIVFGTPGHTPNASRSQSPGLDLEDMDRMEARAEEIRAMRMQTSWVKITTWESLRAGDVVGLASPPPPTPTPIKPGNVTSEESPEKPEAKKE